MARQISLHLAQQIVDTLKTICSHDINLIDTQGRILASTDHRRVNGYHRGGHDAVRRGEIVTIEQDDPHSEVRWGINMPIRFHGSIVAVIGITGAPAEVSRYAALAQRLTLLLLHEQEIEARQFNTRTQTGYLVRALIEREDVSADFLREVLRRNNLSDRGELWRTMVIQLQMGQDNPLSAIEAAVQHLVEGQGGCLYTYRFPNEYVLLVKDREVERWRMPISDLADSFPWDIKIGVGSARRLTRQDLSFQAARLCIQSLAAGENLGYYESMGLELLLSSVSEGARNAYLQKCLKGLDQSDRELLKTYFATEMSLKETARQLFLHINTLQYRLKRIRERCGLDPRRFRDGAALYNALKLEALQGTQAAEVKES